MVPKRLKPLGKMVLIRRDVEAETTDGGLVKAMIALEKQMHGEVIEVGPEVTLVTAGQMVAFKKHSGIEMKLDGKEHVVCYEEDLLGFIS